MDRPEDGKRSPEAAGRGDSIGDGFAEDLVEVGHLPAAVLEAAALVFVGSSGGLHDPVQGQKLVHDELAHL